MQTQTGPDRVLVHGATRWAPVSQSVLGSAAAPILVFLLKKEHYKKRSCRVSSLASKQSDSVRVHVPNMGNRRYRHCMWSTKGSILNKQKTWEIWILFNHLLENIPTHLTINYCPQVIYLILNFYGLYEWPSLYPSPSVVHSNTASFLAEERGKTFTCTLGGRKLESRFRGVRKFRNPLSRSLWFPRWMVPRGSWGCVSPEGQWIGLYPPGGVYASTRTLGRELQSCKVSRKASW